jgi:hypothetical protein
MNAGQPIRVKFQADAQFVDHLKTFQRSHPGEVSIDSEVNERDPAKLGFDLGMIITAITTVSEICEIAKFAAEIVDWVRASRGNKVVLQTPFGTLELRRDRPISKEDVCRFLEAARTTL